MGTGRPIFDDTRDRGASPWDDPSRRPSHADRYIGLGREILQKTFFENFGHSRKTRKTIRRFYKLMELVA